MKGLGITAAALALVVVFVTSGLSVRAQPGASIALPDPGETKQLNPGCNNISLTFPDGTASDTVVQAVTPAGALKAMWRYDAAMKTWLGYSPAAPPAASDLLTVGFLDSVWLCVGESPGASASPSPTATLSAGLTATSLACEGPEGVVGPADDTSITATLTEAGGAPLSGREIVWSGGVVVPAESLTDGSGIATASYMIPWDQGEEWDAVITATFPGDATHASSTCQVTVHAESPAMPQPTP